MHDFVVELERIKYVHYRDINPDINVTNFQTCTKVDFTPIIKNPDHENIHETWGRLMHENNPDYHYKSKSSSEYFEKDGKIYRFSDHWGAIASCEWTIEGRGQLMMSVFDNGDWEIGVADLEDFKVFVRPVQQRKHKVLNPEWIENIAKIEPLVKILEKIKYCMEFKELKNEDKQLVGSSLGWFTRELNFIS
jgi:hypothetical protein